MAIDPRIILASQHVQMPDLLGMAGQAENLKASRRQNKLADLAFADKERAAAMARTEADLYRDATNPDGTFDRQRFLSGAAQNGFGSRIPEWQKGFADQDKARSDADKANFEALGKRLDIAGKAFGYVRTNPTLEAANQTLDFLGAQGVYSPETVAQYKQMVAQDPTKIAGLAEQAFRAVLDAKEQMPKFETRDAGGTVETVAIDPVTGAVRTVNSLTKTQSPDSKASVSASLANAAATRDVAGATREAAGMARDRETEMKLSDDYRNQSKSFKEVSDAYRQISGTLDKATTSPAATLAAATKFMKLLDPGSVVRESELGMALAASGVLDRAGNYFEVLKRGKVLTAQQAADFKAITAQIYQAAQDGQRAIDADYTGRAQRYGLRPENIVQDLGQNSGKSAGGKAAGGDVYAEADAILRGK